MKNKIKTFKEFEMRLKNEQIQKVQINYLLEQKIMDKKKIWKPFYLRTSFIVLFVSLFVTVSIATAVQLTGLKFYNNKKEQIFEIEKMSKESESEGHINDNLVKKNETIMERIEEEIPKGKFVYFLDVEGYEKIGLTSVALLMNPEKIKSVSQIPNTILKSIHLKDEFLEKYKLKEGSIHYRPSSYKESKKVAEKLYLEAKEKNLPYITKEGNLTSKISNIWLTYTNNDKKQFQSFQIQISTVNDKLVTNEDYTGYTQFKEYGIDFLYSEDLQEILFIKEDNSQKLLISILFNQHSQDQKLIIKQELISIAKSMLNI
ncbi:hypothetical protein [Bacillus sp. JJ722]|uniref:hypothetical protein n=1 Tax=Bacillus sp. JJ722 TaxID=3122973 RepID=UPI003000DC72